MAQIPKFFDDMLTKYFEGDQKNYDALNKEIADFIQGQIQKASKRTDLEFAIFNYFDEKLGSK